MKFSRRNLGLVAFLSVGACLLFQSIGNSQNPGPRAKSPSVAELLKSPPRIPTEMEIVKSRIDDLEGKLAAQQKIIDAQQKTIADQQKTLEILTARPKGYTKAFITVGNFKNLPPTDAISYWARY